MGEKIIKYGAQLTLYDNPLLITDVFHKIMDIAFELLGIASYNKTKFIFGT